MDSVCCGRIRWLCIKNNCLFIAVDWLETSSNRSVKKAHKQIAAPRAIIMDRIYLRQPMLISSLDNCTQFSLGAHVIIVRYMLLQPLRPISVGCILRGLLDQESAFKWKWLMAFYNHQK